MKIADRLAGRNAGQPEILTYAVVVNVSGLAEMRDEMHRSASLAQNAHTDWHSLIIASATGARSRLFYCLRASISSQNAQ